MRHWFLLAAALAATSLLAEDEGAAKNRALTFQFLPPPVDEPRYSIGVYDSKGALVRRLHENVAEAKFPAALNGLIVKWDANDDAGKRVPNGKYTLRGLAVPTLKVTGVATRGNDWLADDPRLRLAKVSLQGFHADGRLKAEGETSVGEKIVFHIADGKIRVADGEDASPLIGNPWTITESGALSRELHLPNAPNEPPITAVVGATEFIACTQFASATHWQRTRILKAAPDKGGWEPIFERNIRVPLAWPVPEAAPLLAVELVRNPFVKRGRTTPQLNLRAFADARGTYLATEDGLRLRTVSEARAVLATALAPGAKKGTIRFFQRDAAVSEEFLVEGCDKMMAFEVGRCELGDQGEVEPPAEKD